MNFLRQKLTVESSWIFRFFPIFEVKIEWFSYHYKCKIETIEKKIDWIFDGYFDDETLNIEIVLQIASKKEVLVGKNGPEVL